jgi:hypothetical protein
MKKIYLTLSGICLSLVVFSQCTVLVSTITPSCHGSCDGFAKAVPSGSAGPYTYSWSTTPSQSTALASGLCSGTYTVKVTSASGCNITKTVLLTQPTVLVLATTHTNPKCNGGTAGTATANVSGGTPPYAYNWSTIPARTTKTASGLGAGTYTITVTDKRGCITSGTVTITQPAALTPVATSTNTTCGGSTGTASVTVSGGTGQYTYSWATSPVQTSPSISGLPSGTYAVSIADSYGCKAGTNASVGNTGGLTASTTQINVSCNGGSNGSATILPSGGNAPYVYSWSTFPAQTTGTITGLTAGTYYVSVTDKNLCSYTSTVNITSPPLLATTITRNNVTCTGSASGSATANPTGGNPAYTYSWSTSPVQSTKTANNLAPGTYTLTVTDGNGCTVTKTAAITQPANTLTTTITHTNPKCNGGAAGTATAHAAGGTITYTYSWSTTPPQTTAAITGLAAGMYHLKVTDSKGCFVVDSVIITQPPAISLLTTENPSSCGASTGSASVTASSGGVHPFTYSWNTVPPQAGSTATALAAGIYKVTVTDSNGCKNSVGVTVTNTGGATATISTSTNVACRGGSSGSATVTATGTGGPFSYSWSTTPLQTTATATGLKAGTYTVDVTEANGCATFLTVTITQPVTALKGTVTATDPNCNGGTGSAKAFPTGGTAAYSYSWKTIPVQTSQTALNLSAGTFTVFITDAHGCVSRDTVVLAQPSAITAVITKSNLTCNGGTSGDAAATPSGGTAPYSYSWSTTPVQTTRTITGLTAGTYTVTITDSKGCVKTKTVSLTQPSPILLAATTVNANCGHADGSASVTASGGKPGYLYSWNSTPAQTTSTATTLAAGIYKITVTDTSGCIQTANATVHNANAASAAITSTTISCNGNTNASATITLTGGTGPFSYSWNTNPAQTSATASNLAAGVYSVKVTDANGCVTNDTAVITQPAILVSTLIQTNVSCTATANGNATAMVSGGTGAYSYSWSTIPVQTVSTANGLSAGNYTVTVTDANGCKVSSVATISQKAISAILTESNILCHGNQTGSASVQIVNGTGPYTYSWTSIPAQTTSTAANLIAGTYTVFASDSSGCSTQGVVQITEPSILSDSIALVNVDCYGGLTGMATANASGGTAPYTYSWSTVPAQINNSATNMAAGNYTVLVTDSNSCFQTRSITITQAPAIVGIPTASNASCGLSDGSASVLASGGTGLTYSYSWDSNPPQTADTAFAIAAGIYSVTITDSLGCSNTVSATVNNTSAATISSTQVNATCPTSANGSAKVTVSGGTMPYTYSWTTTPVQTSPDAGGLLAGTYALLVTDSVGCTSTIAVTITSPPALTAIIATTNVTCNGMHNGKATVTTSGGSPKYSYTWSTTPVQTGSTVTGLDSGFYYLAITDSLGCTALDSMIVTQPDLLLSSPVNMHPSCYAGTDGTSSANVSGGILPYSYSWSTNPVQTTDTANGLAAGNYTVLVTDSSGCSVTGQSLISQPANLVLATTSSPASCGNADGSVSVAVLSGGILPFNYSWSSGATSAVASGQSAGTYLVIVTDSAGCSKTDTAYVSNSGGGSLSFNAEPGCTGADNGFVQAVMTGGSAPFNYSWSTVPPQTSAEATGLAPGSYKIMVTDSFGCVVFGTTIITVPVPFVFDSIGHTGITCTGCANATATAVLSGGSAPYTYSWSTTPVQTTQTAMQLASGSYTVCVTDASGCNLCNEITIDNSLGIIVYGTDRMKISYYPNPSTGNLTLTVESASQTQEMNFRLLNLVGQEVYSSQIELTGSRTTRQFDLSSYPKGIYLIQMMNGRETITNKLILR